MCTRLLASHSSYLLFFCFVLHFVNLLIGSRTGCKAPGGKGLNACIFFKSSYLLWSFFLRFFSSLRRWKCSSLFSFSRSFSFLISFILEVFTHAYIYRACTILSIFCHFRLRMTTNFRHAVRATLPYASKLQVIRVIRDRGRERGKKYLYNTSHLPT